MKPLNLDNSPCSPVSSNCVIWQGPNIDCIDLCTGDSISTVVYKLATELCTIMNQLDLTNLDLACLKVGTNPPETFSELIQLLINKICNTPTGSNLPAAITDPCPTNCIVPIAECFQSGTQTTMLLLDYVQMIGEKVCSLVDQIGTINNNITNITNRVTELENKPDPEPYELPPLLVDCTLADGSIIGGNSYRLDLVLLALINDDNHGYCALLSSLGQPGNVTSAYQFQSTTVGNYIGTTGASSSLANCGNPLQSEYTSWITTPLNLSDSFKNLWIAVSDIRRAHKTYEVKNVTGDTSVNITTTTTDTSCGKKDTVTVSANLPIVAPGDNITVTPTVASNVTTYTVAAKGVTGLATSSITTTVDSTGTSHVVSARINDTGWVDLLGFSWFENTSLKPQCRRIGNIVYFRGSLMIPLGNAGNTAVVPYDYSGTGTDTYGSLTQTTPWQGAEGVKLSSASVSIGGSTVTAYSGALQFNENTNVIPTSVVSSGVNFDNTVFSNFIVGSRFFKSKVPTSAVNRQPFSSMIHMVGRLYITSDRKLGIQMLRDLEENSSGYGYTGLSSFATSMFNIIAPPVKVDENIPYFRRGIGADDFTLGSSPNIGIENLSLRYSYTARTSNLNDIGVYPFSCDPNDPSQVGGFGWMSLDGMKAFLAPCNTDIKNSPCP